MKEITAKENWHEYVQRNRSGNYGTTFRCIAQTHPGLELPRLPYNDSQNLKNDRYGKICIIILLALYSRMPMKIRAHIYRKCLRQRHLLMALNMN